MKVASIEVKLVPGTGLMTVFRSHDRIARPAPSVQKNGWVYVSNLAVYHLISHQSANGRGTLVLSVTIQHTKEQLCFAHLEAIAATAGVNLHIHSGANDYGVDGSFRSVTVDHDGQKSRRRETGFAIDFQAKASVAWLRRGEDIVYDLERKAYNDLVRRSLAATTFIVVLLCLPKVRTDWHEVSHDETTMRNACYWVRLYGTPTTNSAKIRIRFPVANLLTAASLGQMLAADQAAREAMFDE